MTSFELRFRRTSPRNSSSGAAPTRTPWVVLLLMVLTLLVGVGQLAAQLGLLRPLVH